MQRRKNIRLEHHLYKSEGMFFITICTDKRRCLLGNIYNEKMHLSPIGLGVQEEIAQFSVFHPDAVIKASVVMPNHVHFLMEYNGETIHIGKIISGFKAAISRQFGKGIWQRNYYENIVRDNNEYWEIVKYIENNPLQWYFDKNYVPDVQQSIL